MNERVSSDRAKQIAGKQFTDTETELALDLLDARNHGEQLEAEMIVERGRRIGAEQRIAELTTERDEARKALRGLLPFVSLASITTDESSAGELALAAARAAAEKEDDHANTPRG